MNSQVLYRKWRSQTLGELVGQPHVTRTLLNALKSGNISHAYLFCGPRGTGKTSTARILAKALNCLKNEGRGEPCNACDMCQAITEDRAMDVIEIDAASNRGIDNIRDLREKVDYAPASARRKVYIIDEFHMLSKEASNALLKTLEEPPPHVVFILATTEAHKVLPTILSRCQHFDFRRHTAANVVAKLTQVCAAEKIKIGPESLHLIARSSTGSLRDAYNLLEQLHTYYGSDIQHEQVKAMLGVTGDARAREIVKHIMANDLSAGMSTLMSVNDDGLDLQNFNREVVEYLRALMLVKTGAGDSLDMPADDIADLKALADKASLGQILNAVKAFGQVVFVNNDSSSLPMELALVECHLSQDGPAAAPPKVTRPAEVHAQPVVSRPVKPAAPQPGESPPAAEPPKKAAAMAAAPTAPAKASVPAPGVKALPSNGSDLDKLRLNWRQMIDGADPTVKKTTASALLRNSSQPVSMEGNNVTLSFGFPILKDKMEKPENKKIAEQIIGAYLGHPCQITCVCEPQKNHLANLVKKMGGQEISGEEK